MEIGEEERYAAGALFTLALHLTQVDEAPVLHPTDLSVCCGNSMKQLNTGESHIIRQGLFGCERIYDTLQVEYGAGGDGTVDAAWGYAPVISFLMPDC